MSIKEDDLRIDVYRVGEDRAVRITHLPTGLVAEASGKSELRCKQVALESLRARFAEETQ